jgi:hypothetical protein
MEYPKEATIQNMYTSIRLAAKTRGMEKEHKDMIKINNPEIHCTLYGSFNIYQAPGSGAILY